MSTEDVNEVLARIYSFFNARRLRVAFVIELMSKARCSQDCKRVSDIQVRHAVSQTSFRQADEVERLVSVFGSVFPQRRIRIIRVRREQVYGLALR